MQFTRLKRRKVQPGAAAPRCVHDYTLLAELVANGEGRSNEIALIHGLDYNYVDRLWQSSRGQIFMDWLQDVPAELLDHFRISDLAERANQAARLRMGLPEE